MLKKGMVHFLATDSHNTNTYENIDLAMKKIKKWNKNDERLQAILSNPEKVINNEMIDIWYPN